MAEERPEMRFVVRSSRTKLQIEIVWRFSANAKEIRSWKWVREEAAKNERNKL